MIWFILVISCFANWRMSHMIAAEEGPGSLFALIRSWVGVRYNSESIPFGTNNLSRGILCVWCVSMWVAFAQCLLFLGSSPLYLAITLPLALSAGSILVETLINGR